MSDDDQTRRQGRAAKSAPVMDERLTRGMLVGRYIVLDVLGEGGMGVVYSAFDPDLDRKVAVKLLQAEPGGSSSGEQAWLVHEAQALARLSHPNVIAVYDVGTLPSGDQGREPKARVYVAMELVEGETLRQWMREKRTWREVVAVMLAAGHGLAAAHAAGLVHRDFKPENVIVGKDGRVRVMDFGLARLPPADESAELPTARDKLPSARMTFTGAVVGTPGYMAPEIYRGKTADARTDQFAFGVTLYEALFDARPYGNEDLAPVVVAEPAAKHIDDVRDVLPSRVAARLRDAVRLAEAEARDVAIAPKPATPPDIGVPLPIRRVVMRAIASASEDRYSSMELLLAELASDPRARRRRVVIGAGAVLALGGMAAAAFALRGPHAEPCTGADQRLAAVWDTPARAKVRAAFGATKLSYAARAYAGLEHALDRYTADWVAMSTESCRATRIRGDQTEDALSLRQDCLDQRLAEVRALVGVLGDATAPMVDKGEKVVAELVPLSRCANLAALRAPGKAPPEIHDKVAAIHELLASARAETIAGRYLPALVAARKAEEQAKAVGWLPSQAEALGIQGSSLLAAGSFAEAPKVFDEATWLGMLGHLDTAVADTALSSALLQATNDKNIAAAKVWLSLGKTATKRAGSDPRLELRVNEVEGIVLAEAGDLLGAVAAHRKAFELAQLEYGKEGVMLYADEGMYASTLEKAFQFSEAVPHFAHAIQLREAMVGPDHTDIATLVSNLGYAQRALHDDAAARASLERALAIREHLYGKNSPILVPTLDNLSDVHKDEGDIPGALAVVERALALAETMPGRDNPVWHAVATDRAELLVLAHRLTDAHALYAQILELEDKTRSATLPQTQRARAELAVVEHEWADAADYAARSVAGYETAGGANNPELWRPLAVLGRAQLELGKLDLAKATLARALAIATTIQLPARDLAPIQALAAHL